MNSMMLVLDYNMVYPFSKWVIKLHAVYLTAIREAIELSKMKILINRSGCSDV